MALPETATGSVSYDELGEGLPLVLLSSGAHAPPARPTGGRATLVSFVDAAFGPAAAVAL